MIGQGVTGKSSSNVSVLVFKMLMILSGIEGEGVDQGLAAPRGGGVTAELAGAQGTGGPQQRYEKKLKINVKQ